MEDLSIGQYCFNGASAFYQSSDHQEKKDPTDHRAEDDDSRIRSDSLSWGIDSEFADHYLYLGWDLVVSMQSFLNALAFEYSNTGYRINFGFSRAGGSFSYVVTSFTGTAVAIYSAAILPILVIVEAVIFFVILHLLPDVKSRSFPMTKEQDRSVSLRKNILS